MNNIYSSNRRVCGAVAFLRGGRERRPANLSRRQWRRRLRIEPLEPRLVLSGESLNLMLGVLPNGASVTTEYDVTVDAPFPKGDFLVQNQATASGNAITSTTNAPVDTIIDRPPQVTGVFVKSSGWSSLFMNHLAAAGLGDATLGYRIPTGADQLDPIPWVGIDSIAMKFSEPVIDIELLSLNLVGVNPITVNGFSHNVDVATWTLSAPVGPNKIRAILDDTVKDATSDQQLDGEWIDGTAVMPSGNGVSGGNFSFRFDTLPGDGTGEGKVTITDVVNMSSRAASGAMVTSPGNTTGNYSIFFDVNGDGAVTSTDTANAVSRLQNVLPAADPGGTPGSGWIAEAAPTTPRPPASAGTLAVTMSAALFTDLDNDSVADPGDTLRYSIVVANTSGAAVTDVQLANTIDPNTTLIAGSENTSPLLSAEADLGGINYLENAPATPVAPNLEVVDPDGTIASATITVAGWVNGQDGLSFDPAPVGVIASYDATTGNLSFTGSATPAQYQSLLRSVKYSNSSNSPNTAARTVNYQVSDGVFTSNTVAIGISVVSVNDAPVLAGIEGATLAYNPTAAAATVTSAITIADVDDANIDGATVAISTGFVAGQDTLAFTPQFGVTGSFVGNTLTLTGSTTKANYETLLRSVTFQNVSGATNTANRTLSFQVNDGEATSNIVTRDIVINRAPIAVADSFNAVGNTQLFVGVTPGSTPARSVGGSVLDSDTDAENNTPLTIGTVNTAGTAGTVAMNSDGTFTFTPNAGFAGPTSFTYTTVDSVGAVSAPGTVTINVANRVWYVDNAAGLGGDGRSNSPFDSLADVTGATGPDAAGDIIYVHTGGSNYGGGMALLTNQTLTGQGIALVVNTFTLQAAGSRPTIENTGASNNAITLANDVTVDGLNVDTTDVVARGVFGTSITNATIGSNVTISGVGGTDFQLTGNATGTINVGATFNDTAGFALLINNRTGGTVNFSGPITVNTPGVNFPISLDTNAGATFNFTGNLSITTNGGGAFTAVSGGTLNIAAAATTSINTTGATGISLSTIASTTGINFDTINVSGGGATGISLVSLTGAGGFTATGGTITGTTSRSLVVTGGSGAINVGASLTNAVSAGNSRTVEFSNYAGTATLSGAIDENDDGILLSNNTGGTINFTGGMDISTGANTGFNATGGGTVSVTGASNTIATTTGTALNVANTNIGASDLTFRSISSSGGTNGIVLNNTGSSGGLTVTGTDGADGGTVPDAGTGGTIQSKSSHGISLTNTVDVTLGGMNITNNLGSGISGSGINGFVLDGMSITGNGDNATFDESGINVADVTGTTSGGAHPTAIRNSTISNNEEFQVQITNNVGTLADFQLTNNTISSNGTTGTIGNLVNFLAAGGSTANMTLNAVGGTYTGAAPNTATGLQADHSGTSGTMTANISGGTFTNNNVAVTVSAANGGNLDFDVSGTTSTFSRAHALNLFVAAISSGTVSGSFTNNFVGTDNVPDSGAALGFGIRVQNEGVSTTNPATVLISGNQIFGMGHPASGPNPAIGFAAINVNQGIFAQPTSRTTNVTITNNVIDDVYNSRGIIIQQNNSTNTTGSAGITNASISGNDLGNNIVGNIGDGTVIRMRQLAGGTFNLTQTSVANLATMNTVGAHTTTTGEISIGGTVTFGQPLPPQPLLASAIGNGLVPALTAAELGGIAADAIDRLAAAVASAAQLALLNSVSFQIVDFAGAQLGAGGAGVVQIDINGAGWGYFVDDSPYDDSEFALLASGGLRADEDSDAYGRIDLLSVVLHELGHILGHDHGDEDDLMGETLETGVRYTALDALFADEDALAEALTN